MEAVEAALSAHSRPVHALQLWPRTASRPNCLFHIAGSEWTMGPSSDRRDRLLTCKVYADPASTLKLPLSS